MRGEAEEDSEGCVRSSFSGSVALALQDVHDLHLWLYFKERSPLSLRRLWIWNRTGLSLRFTATVHYKLPNIKNWNYWGKKAEKFQNLILFEFSSRLDRYEQDRDCPQSEMASKNSQITKEIKKDKNIKNKQKKSDRLTKRQTWKKKINVASLWYKSVYRLCPSQAW